MLRAISSHLCPSAPVGRSAAAGETKMTVCVMMGFGDGVRPPIMTDSPAREIMDAYDPGMLEILGPSADDFTFLNLQEALARDGGVDGVLTVAHPPLKGDLMDKLTPRVISNNGVGLMHVDIDAATERGIAVGNTPNVLNEATADMALTLMLACARRLGETDHYCKSGQWERHAHRTLNVQSLPGTTNLG